MASHPDVVRPSFLWYLLLDGAIAVNAVLALDERAYEAASEVAPLPPRRNLQKVLAATAGIHVVEALIAARRARRHGLPAGRWARQTFVVGFPSLLALRRVARSR